MNIIITKTSFTGLKPDITEQYMQYQKDEWFHRLKQENCSVSFFPTCSRGGRKAFKDICDCYCPGEWCVGDGRHSKEAENEGRVNSPLKIAHSSARIDLLVSAAPQRLRAMILICNIGYSPDSLPGLQQSLPRLL